MLTWHEFRAGTQAKVEGIGWARKCGAMYLEVGGWFLGSEWIPKALLIHVGSFPLLTCSCCCLATQLLSASSQETDCGWAQSVNPGWREERAFL